MMATGTAAVADKPLHRHSKQAVKVTATTDTVGITAYSDTTSYNKAMVADSTDFDEDIDSPFTDSFSDVDNPVQLIAFLSQTKAIGGVIISIIVLFAGLLLVLSPIIIIGLIIYYAMRNRRQKYKLMEKAIEKGQPLPREILDEDAVGNKNMLNKGIKKVAIGLGVAVLCYCLGADPLAGIGWLVFIYGLGLMAIGYFSSDRKKKNEEEWDK